MSNLYNKFVLLGHIAKILRLFLIQAYRLSQYTRLIFNIKDILKIYIANR